MAKIKIMAFTCLVVIFILIGCEYSSNKSKTSDEEKILKSWAPLSMETNPVAEGEMAASPFLTEPVPKTVLIK